MMKQKKQHIALALAAAILTGAVLPAIGVSAEETPIAIPESSYLMDKTGTLSMTVQGGRTLRVKIEKNTLDGVISYYDTILEEDGVYNFTLDSCEYNLDTQAYDSSFTITVLDEKDSDCTYTLQDQLVIDPGFSQEITYTQYDWKVVSVEGEARDVVPYATAATAVNQMWYGTVEVTLQYVPYTLGDVNNDGKIDTFDAYETLLYYAKNSAGFTAQFTDGTSVQAENAAFSAADVTKDGKIDTMDAYYILLYYARVSAGYDPIW